MELKRAVDATSIERMLVVLVAADNLQPLAPSLYRDMHVLLAPGMPLTEAAARVAADFPETRLLVYVVDRLDLEEDVHQFSMDEVIEEHREVEADITLGNLFALRLNQFLLGLEPRVALAAG